MIRDLIESSKKIVIKIGTNALANDDGTININRVYNLSQQISHLIKEGKQIVIISSGARIAGLATLGKWKLKDDMHYKQALCAIGQVELMNAYRKTFREHDIHIGQLLLNREDFYNYKRTINIGNTLFTLLDEGVIPIIDENDTVSVKEIKTEDNDTLAAYTSKLWNADLLIFLGDTDGIYNKNPKEYTDAKLLEEVENIDELDKMIQTGELDEIGTDDIISKMNAAKTLNDCNTPVIIANGKVENILLKLLEGKAKATVLRDIK
ncbi:glutamate 5-kinase [Alkaliphilus metalliredigens QYMF]|uniref:Glutamate 5-kinase n=1 Tax=Alkaliphilus metalliredigens (strain QYMF) TaxID=293826 RepID=A6TL30_ALKMQ|nr:glutamate 5-kinase [Alkaliphilus metalliredigens]ABR46898.1 glutamate 5-kinase [Alkaliphilus metalliredigens QYMF]